MDMKKGVALKGEAPEISREGVLLAPLWLLATSRHSVQMVSAYLMRPTAIAFEL
jgi:hypothetical protein